MKSIRLNGDTGALIIDDTSAHTGLSKNLINVTEDTAISVCTGVDHKGNAVNFKTLLNWDGTITTLHNPLTIPRGYKINAITLTSGEIVTY
jgi:hypothetical protein